MKDAYTIKYELAPDGGNRSEALTSPTGPMSPDGRNSPVERDKE